METICHSWNSREMDTALQTKPHLYIGLFVIAARKAVKRVGSNLIPGHLPQIRIGIGH